jgi:hypothetical protein
MLKMRALRQLGVAAAAFAAAASASTAQPSDAEQAARLTIARQIVTLRADDASDMTMLQAKLPYFVASIDQAAHLSDAERAALPSLLQQAYRAVRIPAREQIAATYARAFSADQLRQLLAFYQSDAGQAFLAHQQELTTAAINLQRLSDAAVIASVVHSVEDARRSSAQ